MKLQHVLVGLILIVGFSGCSSLSSNKVLYGTLGSAGGAGAGALVGSLISNGDVLASAGLGAGVGVAAGVLAGHYIDLKEQAEIERVSAELDRNQEVLNQRDREIQAMYQRVHQDSQREQLDPSSVQHDYTGPTVGTYNR